MNMTFLRVATAAALLVGAGSSLAHIGYGSGPAQSATSRNFGTVNVGYNFTFTGRNVTSNFGWADASDLNLAFDAGFAATRPASSDSSGWGNGGFATGVDNLYFADSHKGTAYRFTLTGTTTVLISLKGVTGAAGATGGALTPGFSVYKGLAAVSPFTAPQTSADYDFSVASRAQRTAWAQANVGAGFNYLATQGNWNALGDWYSGGDNDVVGDLAALSFFDYQGSANSNVNGGTAFASLTLDAGNYTIYLGGNDLASKDATQSALRYGFDLNVTAVPEPQTWILLAAGLPLLARRLAARRR